MQTVTSSISFYLSYRLILIIIHHILNEIEAKTISISFSLIWRLIELGFNFFIYFPDLYFNVFGLDASPVDR